MAVVCFTADIVEQSTRRRGRVAEGTSLLRKHTGKTCIVGSNPTVSARTKQKSLPCGRLFCFVRTETVRQGGRFERLGRAGPTLSESPNCCRAAAAPRAEGARRLHHCKVNLDQTTTDLYYGGQFWRRGRVAEGTSLLRKHTGKTCIVGSNPTVSARTLKKTRLARVFFRPYCLSQPGRGRRLTAHERRTGRRPSH